MVSIHPWLRRLPSNLNLALNSLKNREATLPVFYCPLVMNG